MTRSTAKAGQLQAGRTITATVDLAALTRAATIDATDANAATVAALVAANDEAIENLTARRPAALIAGTVEEIDAELARAERTGERLAAVADSIATRRAELVADAERSAAEAQVDAARKAMDEAEAEVAGYETDARSIAARIERLRALHATVEAGRRAAREHDLDPCELALPHERRSTPEAWVVDESIEDGILRRRDRRVRSAVMAADLTSARVELPAIDGGAAIVSQGRR